MKLLKYLSSEPVEYNMLKWFSVQYHTKPIINCKKIFHTYQKIFGIHYVKTGRLKNKLVRHRLCYKCK